VLFRILTGQLFVAKGWRIVDVTRSDHGLLVHLEPTRVSTSAVIEG
jgi:hypothetical protein